MLNNPKRTQLGKANFQKLEEREDYIMDDERYKLQVEKRKPKKPNEVIAKTSRRNIAKAEAYASLVEHYGFKLLMEEFVEPRLSPKDFFTVPDDKLPLIRAKMLAFKEMLTFITRRIKEANVHHEFLERVKKYNEEVEKE